MEAEEVQKLDEGIAAILNEDSTDIVVPGATGSPTDPTPPAGNNDPPPATPEPIKPADPAPVNDEVLSIKDMASILKARVSNDQYQYEIPDDIVTGINKEGKKLTKDELFDRMHSEILQFTDTGDDDFTMSYKKAKADPNFKMDEFIGSYNQSYSFLKLPDDEVLFQGLKARVGESLSDQDIKEHIGQMSKIDKVTQAKGIRDAYKTFMDQQNIAKQTESKTLRDKEIVSRKLKDTTDLDLLFKKISTTDNIGGLPHGKAEQETFNKAFASLYDIDSETGKRQYEKLLEDPETLYQALFFITKLKGGEVKSYLSKRFEEFKTSTIDKLGIGQRASDGTIVTKTPPSPDDYVD